MNAQVLGERVNDTAKHVNGSRNGSWKERSAGPEASDGLLDLQRQIYQDSRSSNGPVPQLMTWVLDRRNLDAAWQRVRTAHGANTPGIDGMIADDVSDHVGRWLTRLADEVLHERYRPRPPRWVDVPKTPDGTEMRRLGILTIRDRLMHTALKQVFEPILEPLFHANSFGFRPGRSVAAALEAASRALRDDDDAGPAFRYAIPLDVADCFGTIGHDVLLERLETVTSDQDVLKLIAALIRSGENASGLWRKRGLGVVQGSSFSPLLCNFYLHPLDLELSRFGQANQGGVKALRYADDLLVLARDRKLARGAVTCAKRKLRSLGQRFGRSRRVQKVSDGVEWLGVSLHPRPNRWTGRFEVGYVIPDRKVLKMLERIDEMTVPPSSRIDSTAFDLGRWIVSINDQLRDWWQAYLYAENTPEIFRTLDARTHERVGELLHSVTGVRRRELWREYRVRLPRGFSSWQINGVRLVTLSSLAPRRPHKLTRRPAWMQSKR